MLPLQRSTLVLRIGIDLLHTGVTLNAPLRPQDVSASRSRRGGGKKHPSGISRRNLFELHSGRQVRKIPSKLLLEETSRVQKTTSVRDTWSFLRHTTSEDLIAALGPIGVEYKVDPKHLRHKVDLSYVEDAAMLIFGRDQVAKQAREIEEKVKKFRKHRVIQVNVKILLIQYLRHVHPILTYQSRFTDTKFPEKRLDDALLGLMNEEADLYLKSKGRDIRDLMTWTWILTSETSERAALRLLAVAHQDFINTTGRLSVPLFIYVFLLRRRNSIEALRSLLIYAWKLMEVSEKEMVELVPSKNEAIPVENLRRLYIIKSPEDDKLGIKERIFMIIVIRLLRSARKVWPAACNSIVTLISRYLNGLNFREDVSPTTKLTVEDTVRLTYMYNTLLKLVSLPASIGPYRSAFYQQRAQFSLLRRMNMFQPPLIVDRKGYRAVISMQLMHKKSLKEREWAQMKARSWPPWKKDKLGIDATIGVEHGVSRAMEAMKRSWEAGYAPDEWDAVASVLSGWDTDGSPTIQTRAVHPGTERSSASATVWCSRIRATRTLDEAWSCFLSYKDQRVTPAGAHYVYHQMFTHIVQDTKRASAESLNPTSTKVRDEQQPLPGDGIEVVGAPESLREGIYVRTPPPTIGAFVEMMARDNIKPRAKFLSSMLETAPTLETGLQYLEASIIPNEHIRILRDRKPPSNAEDQAALESIPDGLFSSFIRLLVEIAPRIRSEPESNDLSPLRTKSTLNTVTEKTELARLGAPGMEESLKPAYPSRYTVGHSLFEAIELVLARKPRHRPVWYHLLRALSRPGVIVDPASRFINQNYQDLKAWQITCHLLDEIFDIDLTLDLDGFHVLCLGLEKAIFAAERLSKSSPYRRGNNDLSHNVLSTGLPLLKQIFKDVVRSKSMWQDIPTSLTEETSRINTSVEEQSGSESDETEEDVHDNAMKESGAFLPPACLLPKLLEVPHPACLHAFVRVLGLRGDYDGLLDLVEWMSLFADEIHEVVDESANGYRMMRRCLTAIRVYMERSWVTLEEREAEAQEEDPSTVGDEPELEEEPAPTGIVKAVKEVVSGHLRWGGWPKPHEVEEYCANMKIL